MHKVTDGFWSCSGSPLALLQQGIDRNDEWFVHRPRCIWGLEGSMEQNLVLLCPHRHHRRRSPRNRRLQPLDRRRLNADRT